MNVTREVILDLLPVVLSGEASVASRELVEEYLRHDPELAARVRSGGWEGIPGTAVGPPPEVELRALGRTRRLLQVQKWLFALAWTFTALSLTSAISFDDHRVSRFRFLIVDYPGIFGPCLGVAVGCWIGYALLKRRLRGSAF